MQVFAWLASPRCPLPLEDRCFADSLLLPLAGSVVNASVPAQIVEPPTWRNVAIEVTDEGVSQLTAAAIDELVKDW